VVDKGGHPVVFVIEIAKIVEKEDHGMADEYRMALTELLRKAQMEGGHRFPEGRDEGSQPGGDGAGGEPATGSWAIREDP
jgi:hypothetical protein